jgi:ATP-binding cassette, subfamily B (MDR/TAP), member 1
MIIGSVCSVIIGGAVPLLCYLWGKNINSFSNSSEMVNEAITTFIEYIIFGAIAIFAGWGMHYFWMAAGESQINECRNRYLDAMIRQEMGWFETQQNS